MAKAANDEFKKVLEQDPKNDRWPSLHLASLVPEPEEVGRSRSSGTRSWSPSIPRTRTPTTPWASSPGPSGIRPDGMARADLGMKPDDPGPAQGQEGQGGAEGQVPARDRRRHRRLCRRLCEIDPEYDDAMAYMNLLIRERADLADTTDEYKKRDRRSPTTGCRRLSTPRRSRPSASQRKPAAASSPKPSKRNLSGSVSVARFAAAFASEAAGHSHRCLQLK